MNLKQQLATIFLWFWVIGISVAYLYQFSHFLEPILKILGLK